MCRLVYRLRAWSNLTSVFHGSGTYYHRLKKDIYVKVHGKPVWPSGKALWLVSRGTSVRSASVLLSLLLKNCGLWTLYCDFAHTINETLIRLTQLPTLVQSHSGGDSVASRC